VFTNDFNGKYNTSVLINLATRQTNWKDAPIIENWGNEGYYPAACCCWLYRTEGTTQGDWYLPACGELGHVMSNL
jgi:hypothetical protein